MDQRIKLFKSYILYTLSAFGMSMGIVADIGVSSYNAMNLAIAHTVDLQVGTITIILNLAFLMTYMVLTRFKYKAKYLLQGVSVAFLGILINVFTYRVLGHMPPLAYYQRVFLFVLGTTISGLSIGGIIHYNQMTFPLESVCLRLSEMTTLSFVKLRYSVDLLSVTISIILSGVNSLPLFVREGTLISMLVLTFTMNASKVFFEKREKEGLLC